MQFLNIENLLDIVYKALYSVLHPAATAPIGIPAYPAVVLFFLILISLIFLWYIFFVWTEVRRFYLEENWAIHNRMLAARTKPENLVWKEINDKAASDNPSDWTAAIIAADKLLDNVLAERGIEGDSLGDKLKGFDKKTSPWLNDAWEAHKVRNKIAHETGYEPNRYETRRAIGGYENVLRSLGAK